MFICAVQPRASDQLVSISQLLPRDHFGPRGDEADGVSLPGVARLWLPGC